MAILAALPHLGLIGRPVSTLHYVGDLDLAGLEIAISAQEVARRAGLPALAAAPGAHMKMLLSAKALGGAGGWKTTSTRHRPDCLDRALEFLPAQVRELARSIIASKSRVPEEVLGPDELHELFSLPAA